MLFRHVADTTQNVQIFGGLRTVNPIADNNAIYGLGSVHQLQIVLDTTGDGTGFLANFFIDGVSVLPGGVPTAVSRNIDDINFAGLAFDNSTATVVSFDNFMLTAVPEPATGGLVLLGMGTWLAARKPRRNAA
jgi:hypothetical protein